MWVCVGAAHLHAVEVLKCSGEAARVAGSSRKNWLVRVRVRARVRVRVRVRIRATVRARVKVRGESARSPLTRPSATKPPACRMRVRSPASG